MNRPTTKPPSAFGSFLATYSSGEREALRKGADSLIKLNSRWLQFEPRTISTIANTFFPRACQEALDTWLLEELGNALLDAGYFQEPVITDDPTWAWGEDTVEPRRDTGSYYEDYTPWDYRSDGLDNPKRTRK